MIPRLLIAVVIIIAFADRVSSASLAIRERAPSSNGIYIQENSNQIIIDNKYVQVIFDSSNNAIEAISADFSGEGQFNVNLLTAPFQLQVTSEFGIRIARNDNDPKTSKLRIENYDRGVKLISTLSESSIEETWEIELVEDSRAVKIGVSGTALKNVLANHISYELPLMPPSLYGLFDSGVVQMMNKGGYCLGTSERLERAYFLGNGSAIDVIATSSDSTLQSIVLYSGSSYAMDNPNSLIEFVIQGGGNYPNQSKDLNRAWSSKCWKEAPAVTLEKGMTWSIDFNFIPNNFDFPVYLLQNITESKSNLPFIDLQTYMTGLYGSPAGCLQSYYTNQRGIIAPTISHPDAGYSPDTNFFDPDNFISLSALLYSGDEYMVNQVREVIERTAETMCGIGSSQDKYYCQQARKRVNLDKSYKSSRFKKLFTDRLHGSTRDGQLMHHFVSLSPTYESIAGSEQLGPNIFWTLSALRYVSLTQNRTWAEEIFPYVELSTMFILSFIDSDKYLVNAPGPLWIDVLIRENFTADSTAMMVPVLREIAEFYEFLNFDESSLQFATELRSIGDRITFALNKYLWAADSDDDHFITQLNLDGSTRDFVDYDSNLIAVAFGLVTKDRADKILARVDSGKYTHIRATWCSEIPYSGNASDCYIVGGSVCGDSVVTLARIGWVDALARKQVNDIQTLLQILQPLQTDLVADTWLYERYDSTGNQIRTAYYFEYPSLVTMVLREVVYGINIGLQNVAIEPLQNSSFLFAFGNTRVSFDVNLVQLSLPGEISLVKAKETTISNLLSNTIYDISTDNCDDRGFVTQRVLSDKAGKIAFFASYFTGCTITAKRASYQ